jgi:hypothetical protein
LDDFQKIAHIVVEILLRTHRTVGPARSHEKSSTHSLVVTVLYLDCERFHGLRNTYISVPLGRNRPTVFGSLIFEQNV